MQIESRKNRQNKKAKRLNSIRGTQRFTKPSQTNGGANIRINSETAIPKLKNLAQEYIGVSDPYGFLTNLRKALGIPNSQGASKYGVVTIPKEDGSVLEASLRITNHNSDAETYIAHNANYEYNLSILVRKNFKPNTFKPHNDVVLDEFVYYGKRMQRVENPLAQIINSIIGFLQSGVYNDTTGVAFKNTSPQTNDNNQLNCNTNMNKKLIRLTESDLHRIVKRSVNKVLREGINDITPLSTHIQNNQDADLETLGNIVDDLRKVKEGGALSKWNPTIAARLKKSGLVDTETVQAITQISLLIYRLGNMDFSHKRVYNGETFDDTWNRLQHEQD